MGMFKEEIILENARDRALADGGALKEEEIRALKVEAIPDTGAWSLVINEDVRQKLGLAIKRKRWSTLADGTSGTYDVTDAVIVQWKNRDTVSPAIVLPGAKEILLGAMPLEGMDLMVDPVNGKLVGVHGEEPEYMIL
jgi:clan AA aspartic protease